MNILSFFKKQRERRLRERCLRYAIRVSDGRCDRYQIIWYADRCYDFITKGKIITSQYDWENIRES